MPGFFDVIFGSKPVEPEEPKPKKNKPSIIDLKLNKEKRFRRPKKKSVKEKGESRDLTTEVE